MDAAYTTKELLSVLCSKDKKESYGALDELEATAECSEQLCKKHFETVVRLLQNENSFVRNRAARLVSIMSKRIDADKMASAMPAYLHLLHDEKPITVRMCLQNLPVIIKAHPELCRVKSKVVSEADFSKHKDSMSPLLIKDAKAVMEFIDSNNT